jgi:hypothetical protein
MSSKAGKALHAKSTKSAALDKPTQPAEHMQQEEEVLIISKSSKMTKETQHFLDDPSSSPSMLPVLVSLEPTASHPVPKPSSHIMSPTHHNIFAPTANDTEPVKTQTKKPSTSPGSIHNLFGPVDSGGNDAANESPAPSGKSYDDETTSPSTLSTTQPVLSNKANIPSSVPSMMEPSASPFVQQLFGSGNVDYSTTTPTPTVVDHGNAGADMDSPTPTTVKPSSSFITPPTNKEASFTTTVSLFANASSSLAPSSTPSESSSLDSSAPSFSSAPTESKQSNLLAEANANDKFQGLASILVILACVMVVLGTLFTVSRTMKKDEQGQPVMAASNSHVDDIAYIGEVVEEGGGNDSERHLQLVTGENMSADSLPFDECDVE